ncbi:Serine/threonine protein kinase PrkC regulator of stationary phase [Patulibacter medicamentivorans]|uniref:non-specific serine/threonine protein kinase n=1 Tax=Patulibacter medicamentivorans TaxID=1097667 RepID=H0E0X9_9ACTN|nr:protein kinase [Patulibacter medicamentivorans]EHN12669.1 Serine/threonine protein kinase PrkC regulator of stationary phase [Patulibacter medicamentivorans]
MTIDVGTLLADRYRLEAQIGSGGMSTVYRAFDTVLERTVAIKRMHREIAEHSEQLERFRREARAVAQLNHPHIVQVIDAGEHDDTPFIVFEHVRGETLKERIQRAGRLPVTEAVAYAIEIARALGAAHDRGIVHRDVKPQNVLINEEGLAKVTDFGIARTLEEHGLTADGRVLGTTDYVSPEQAMGHEVTGQSDIYSLGIVLFEMLVGDIPFHGENQVAVAMKHVREELPDVQALRPSVGAALAAVVDRATAKDLDVRYPSTDDLVADLEDVLTIEASRRGEATGEATAVLRTLPPQKRQRLNLRVRRRGLLLVAIVLVLGALAAAAIQLLPDATQRGTGQRPSTPAAKGEVAVSLSPNDAHDYDPLGDNAEHSSETARVLDGDPNTDWSTERYTGGTLPKQGVGIYLDVGSETVSATRLSLATSTPGWSGKVYAAADGSGPPAGFPDPGWVAVGDIEDARAKQNVPLKTNGTRYRYYLVWITALPEGGGKVGISSLSLLRRR